jgi:hypothetical protein
MPAMTIRGVHESQPRIPTVVTMPGKADTIPQRS